MWKLTGIACYNTLFECTRVHVACDIGVIPTRGSSTSDQDQAKEDIHDWFRWPQAHLPVQRPRGPPPGREDHAVHGHHQQHVCQGLQVCTHEL